MFFNKKKEKRFRWESVSCGVGIILRILEQCEDCSVQLVVRYHGAYYNIGIASDYDRQTRKFFDTIFYLNEQEFLSLDEFKSSAKINDILFTDICDMMEVVEADEGNPINLTILKDLVG